MERIRVSKVEDVTLWRRGTRFEGTLHLMPHHIVFRYLPTPPPGSSAPSQPPRQKEVWITYPMISHCVLRPSPPASHQSPSIRLRCRDFTFFAFNFVDEKKAREVYDSIRGLSCKLGRLDKLLAFAYVPKPPEDKYNGWEIYDARKEFKRLGISSKDSEKGWRISEINKDYKYSPTYPALIAVPTKISDNVLKYAGIYRSRQRIPALVYRHPINNCSITRSSQPMPGIRGNRNSQDEKLVAAIFATNSGWKSSQGSTLSPDGASPDSSTVNLHESGADSSFVGVAETEAVDAGRTNVDDLTNMTEADSDTPKVYGAQQRNAIVDARPTVNALAMQAVGLGSEKMDYYPGAEKAYLGIDNIHVMRKSLEQVIDALKDSDITSLPPNRSALQKSGWTKHITNIMDGTYLIANTVGILHSHVLIHCSDGWDRTSQLSALSQICLDPYYRTLEGFIVLVEKDWLSYGHMFRHRSGFLGSDKWFSIENERIERKGDDAFGNNPLENALRGARGFFNRNNDSTESLSQATDTNGGELTSVSDVAPPADGTSTPKSTTVGAAEEHRVTKVNELSPVFHQFLDATYQLLYQYPNRFEFNERFLRRLLYHLYSCQYGTFLFDNEKERVDARAAQRTRSVWDYFLCRRQEFINTDFNPTIDDNIRGQERIILPKKGQQARWWSEAFGRVDDDMNFPFGPQVPGLTPQSSNMSSPPNGRTSPLMRSGASTPVPSTIPVAPSMPFQSQEPNITATEKEPEPPKPTSANTPIPPDEPIVTGTETAEQATGAGSTHHADPLGALSATPVSNTLPDPSSFAEDLGSEVMDGLSSLKVADRETEDRSRSRSKGRAGSGGAGAGAGLRKEMEVEMQ